MAKKYFDEEWPKEEEILRIGLEMSKKNKADRFPTADERWPRQGKIMKKHWHDKVTNLHRIYRVAEYLLIRSKRNK